MTYKIATFSPAMGTEFSNRVYNTIDEAKKALLAQLDNEDHDCVLRGDHYHYVGKPCTKFVGIVSWS